MYTHNSITLRIKWCTSLTNHCTMSAAVIQQVCSLQNRPRRIARKIAHGTYMRETLRSRKFAEGAEVIVTRRGTRAFLRTRLVSARPNSSTGTTLRRSRDRSLADCFGRKYDEITRAGIHACGGGIYWGGSALSSRLISLSLAGHRGENFGSLYRSKGGVGRSGPIWFLCFASILHYEIKFLIVLVLQHQ